MVVKEKRSSKSSVDSLTKFSRDLAKKKAINKTPLTTKAKTITKKNYNDDFDKYKDDIGAYAYDMFGIKLSKQQKNVCKALLEKRYVCVRSAHATGKSYLMGILINYFFDVYTPLIGVVTAPTQDLVEDVAFKYARLMRDLAKDKLPDYWKGPAAPHIEKNHDHWIIGLSTGSPDSLQGRHGVNVVILVDESVGVTAEMFEALESLMIGDNVFVLCIYNPTKPESYVAGLEGLPQWEVVTMSAYDHENIWAGVENLMNGKKTTDDLPFPGAMNLERFEQLLLQWSTRITEDSYDPKIDIILPSSVLLDEPIYLRPGSQAESRLLGRWPTVAMDTIFSEYDVQQARNVNPKAVETEDLKVGVDVARYGSDYSAWCVVKGGRVLDIIEANGLSSTKVANKTIELLKMLEDKYNVSAFSIPVAIDGIGWGAGVVDVLTDSGYNVVDVIVSESAFDKNEYTNLRTELWFVASKALKEGAYSFADLNHDTYRLLQKQLMAPQYSYDSKSRRAVQSKKEIKKKMGRSTDIADAFIMTFALDLDISSGMSVELEDVDDIFSKVKDTQ